MSEPVDLSEVPGRFLNRKSWNLLRKSSSQEIIALSYINAPYPEEEDSGVAVRRYWTGRSLLGECRSLLNEGKLIATGTDTRTGKRKVIPSGEWINLWPMFVTNKATGPNKAYEEVQVFAARSSDTPHEKLASKCTEWLKQQRAAGITQKKIVLYEDARHLFGQGLTHVIFDSAYLAAFGRGRGRPRKISEDS